MLKKRLSLICFVLLMVISLAACQKEKDLGEENAAKQNEAEQVEEQASLDLSLGAMTGPTGVGVVHLLENKEFNIDFHLSSTPEDLVASLSNASLDAAVIPLNMAVKLYEKGVPIQVLATNNLGVIYGLSTEDLGIEEFLKKDLYSTGKGATPEVILTILAKKYGLDSSLSVEYFNDPAELVQRALKGESEHLILPEPMVTKVMEKVDKFHLIDFNQAWEEAFEGSQIITSVLVAQKDFAEKDQLREAFVASVEKTSDVEETAALAGKADIFEEEILKKAIPRFSYRAMIGQELQEEVQDYLTILQEEAPDFIGDQLPGVDFIYE